MDKQLLIENHNGSLRKLLKIYNTKGDLYKGVILLLSLNIDIAISIFIDVLKLDVYKLVVSFTNIYMTILPSLLGFNLGAYALLIGLASSDLIKKMSSSYETKFTSFQRASSVFGFCVLLQALALIIAFLFQISINLGADVSLNIHPHSNFELFFDCLNFSGLFILNLFGIYSILILISVIGSIFAISQAAHFYAVTDHIRSDSEGVGDN